jgi:hypothetical protein
VPWLCPGPLLLCLCPAAVAVCGNDGLVADPARACVRPAIDSLRSGGALRVCASGGCVVGVSATERRWCGGGCWRAPGGAGPPCLLPPGRCRRRRHRRCRLHTPHPTPHTCTSHAPPRTDPPRWYSMAHTRELTNLSGQGHVCVLAGEVHGAQAGWAHGVHGPGSGCAPSLPARVGAMAGPALGQPAAAGWLEGSAHAPAAGRRACCAVLCCPAPPRPCAPADASASASASASAGPADSAQRLLAARPSLCRWPAAGLACQTQPPEEVKQWLADRQCAVCSLTGWLAGWLAGWQFGAFDAAWVAGCARRGLALRHRGVRARRRAWRAWRVAQLVLHERRQLRELATEVGRGWRARRSFRCVRACVR